MTAPSPAEPAPPPSSPAALAPIPPAVAWRGLLGTGVAALLASLSWQVHSFALPDLAGATGQSTATASWITGAGAASEAAAVLAAAPLGRALGLRRLLVGACLGGGALAALALTTRGLAALIALRGASGFLLGMLPVLMMVWSLRAFPSGRNGLPLMLFAAATSMPAAFAALVAGQVTGTLSGLGGFAFDAAWTLPAALLGFLLLPPEPAAPALLRGWDWPGYLLAAAAAACLMLVLNQGEARFWLETPWMAPLLAAGVALAGLALLRLVTARTPWLDLHLLKLPTFSVAIAEALSLRFGLMLAAFAVPQALARLQGFRPEQVGEATLWLGAGQLVGFPLAWAWVRFGDARQPLAAGLSLFVVGALMAAQVTPAWQAPQFAGPLLAAGVGQGLFLTAILRFATADVPPAGGPTAAALFNLTRVLGQAGAAAALGALLRVRENLHSSRLVETLSGDDRALTQQLDALTRTYASVSGDGAAAVGAALGAVARRATAQAYVLGFGDVFLGIAASLVGFVLLVPLLPRLPRKGAGA